MNINFDKLLIEDYLDLDEKSQVKDYFVICTMYGDIVAYGAISSLNADDAMSDFFDNTNIAYDGEYEDEDGEFDWDGLTRYVWELDGTETLPQTDDEAKAFLDSQIDDNTVIEAVEVTENTDGITEAVADALIEAHYDPADYWHEDPYWYRKPRGVKSPDDELMARAEKKYGNRGDYSKIPAKKDYVDEEAAKAFWANAKKNVIDYVSFHKAFDDSLAAAKCPTSIWSSSNTLVSSRTWSIIKNLDSSLASVRALKKLWALTFKSDATVLDTNQGEV